MKKVILGMLILTLTLSLFCGVMTVSAETSEQVQYNKITEGVTFIDPTNASIAELKLPVGYWVKYLGASGAGHKVEYNGVELYVSNDNFVNMNKFDNTIYKPLTKPMYSIPAIHVVINEAAEIYDRKLYSSKECIKANMLADSATEPDEELIFLSTDKDNSGVPVYLVAKSLPGGSHLIGYIKADFTDTPNIVIPPAVAPELKPQPTPDPDKPVTPEGGEGVLPDTGGGELGGGVLPDADDQDLPTKNNIVKIILIVAICLLAVILVFLIFKPTRDKNKDYDVDDYDDYDRDDAYQDRY